MLFCCACLFRPWLPFQAILYTRNLRQGLRPFRVFEFLLFNDRRWNLPVEIRKCPNLSQIRPTTNLLPGIVQCFFRMTSKAPFSCSRICVFLSLFPTKALSSDTYQINLLPRYDCLTITNTIATTSKKLIRFKLTWYQLIKSKNFSVKRIKF